MCQNTAPFLTRLITFALSHKEGFAVICDHLFKLVTVKQRFQVCSNNFLRFTVMDTVIEATCSKPRPLCSKYIT